METIAELIKRIEERFPSSGLAKVCKELYTVTTANKERVEYITKPNYILRTFIGFIVFIIASALIYSFSIMDIRTKSFDFGELVQIAEAAINDIVLIGAAIFFLITVETRVKRSRVLEALHELRTIAHVIDMHQLTKDPGRYKKDMQRTKSSPKRELSQYELSRYFDYCSEMLSLTGKVAALIPLKNRLVALYNQEILVYEFDT
ncbi:MAG: hypothetical protein ABUK01_11500 [Leptospirales bacterium]